MKEKDLIKKISKKSFKKKLKKTGENISLLNNRYYLNEEIGEGGLSVVYSANDIYCDYFDEPSNIVIKIPSNELQKHKDVAAFMYSEYSFLKKLNHANIVKSLDFGIDDKSNIPYLVLEYLRGKTLAEVPINSMDKSFKNILFKKLLKSIMYIHSKNIIHADINPSNIMILKDSVTLFDFGISQNTQQNKEISLEYKKVKAFNPKYSAPEVLLGEKPTKESDLFSLACVMYEIYNCKSLFKENSLKETKNKKYLDNLSNIPFLFRNWFKKSLSLSPHNRRLTTSLKLFLIIK